MGNVPCTPSLRNLPQPEADSKLANTLTQAGFVFVSTSSKQSVTTSVTSPAGWFLRNTCSSTYSDHVDMQLCDPQGHVVAVISGKFTSYGSYCHMVEAEKDVCIDMATGTIDADGWFVDAITTHQRKVKAYKAQCTHYLGYAHDQQAACDALFEALRAEASVLGIAFTVQRIALGDDPLKGGLKAMAAAASGVDTQ